MLAYASLFFLLRVYLDFLFINFVASFRETTS